MTEFFGFFQCALEIPPKNSENSGSERASTVIAQNRNLLGVLRGRDHLRLFGLPRQFKNPVSEDQGRGRTHEAHLLSPAGPSGSVSATREGIRYPAEKTGSLIGSRRKLEGLAGTGIRRPRDGNRLNAGRDSYQVSVAPPPAPSAVPSKPWMF